MFMGKLIGYAAMKLNYNVTWISSYGAEARGGASYCMVIISDNPIPSPVVEEPDICIVMNNPSFEKFSKKLKKKGLLIMNSSMIEDGNSTRKDIRSVKVPMTRLAFSLGNTRVSNMVALGTFILKERIFDLDSILKILEEFIPSHRRNLLDINKKALVKGYEFAKRYKS